MAVIDTITSKQSGIYQFDNVPPGEYEIQASYTGLAFNPSPLVLVVESAMINADIMAYPTSMGGAPPAPSNTPLAVSGYGANFITGYVRAHPSGVGLANITLELNQTLAYTVPDAPPNLPDDIVTTAPTGGRDVPDALNAALQAGDQQMAWCWVVWPKSGDPEAYTDWDEPLACPAYTAANGLNPVPALTYLSRRAVELSAIPATIQKQVDGTDVKLLNFNRQRLEAGYYQDAEYEIFQVNVDSDRTERWVASSGTMGSAPEGDLAAMVELTDWTNYLQQPIGDSMNAQCRHIFGIGQAGKEGCYCADLDEGPLLSDWTRAAEVVSVVSASRFTVRLSGIVEGDDFMTRLAHGRVHATSGNNDGAERHVKEGAGVAGSYSGGEGNAIITLYQALPYLPAVGDTMDVSSGCRKTWEACQEYANTNNFGGFRLPIIQVEQDA